MKYDSAMYTTPPLVTSADLAWRGLRVEQYQLNAMELPAHYHQHHLLMMHQPVSGPLGVRRQQGSQTQEATFRTGDLGLYPEGEYGSVAWNGLTNIINIYIDNEHLENLAYQAVGLTNLKLTDRLQFSDELLGQLGRQLYQSIGATHALGLLYVESLTNMLGFHLIEHYAAHQRNLADGCRLPQAVLSRIDAYLDTYADQPVSLKTLAGLANLSLFYFSRLFKKTTGKSPYQYVVAWKIQRARQLLRTDTPIINVSDALGFASSAHFATAFKRAVGVSPHEYRYG